MGLKMLMILSVMWTMAGCAFGQAGAEKKFLPGGTIYQSAFGRRQTVILPDKTEVTLNSNSRLSLTKNFDAANRSVKLSGDALFVVRAGRAPLVINTPHLVLSIRTGVARVNAYEGKAGEETLLLRGTLHAVKNYYSALDHDPYTIAAGDMVMMNKDIDLMEKETFDSLELKGWIADKLIFKNSPVVQTVKTVGDWYSTEIMVAGNTQRAPNFSGMFDHASLQDVLAVLQKVWHCRATTGAGGVVLSF